MQLEAEISGFKNSSSEKTLVQSSNPRVNQPPKYSWIRNVDIINTKSHLFLGLGTIVGIVFVVLRLNTSTSEKVFEAAILTSILTISINLIKRPNQQQTPKTPSIAQQITNPIKKVRFCDENVIIAFVDKEEEEEGEFYSGYISSDSDDSVQCIDLDLIESNPFYDNDENASLHVELPSPAGSDITVWGSKENSPTQNLSPISPIDFEVE